MVWKNCTKVGFGIKGNVVVAYYDEGPGPANYAI